MANYYIDENGRITTKKPKKNVNLPDYKMNANGDILLVEEDEEDIAPVKTTVSQTADKERTWFQKSALFDDGYQFGDVTKTILGSKTDVAENVGAGIIGMGEKALDALLWASTYMAQGQYYSNGGGYNIAADRAFDQAIDLAKAENEKFIAKDLYDEEAVAKTIISAPVKKLTGIDAETDSVFGEKSDSLAQSAGQLGATVALSAAGVPWYLTTGATAFGGEVENALNQGATMEEAGLSAAISAGAEILTEKLSGGISFGGNTLDDVLVKELSRIISDKTLRTMLKLGMDAVGEGSEEILSGVMSAIGQKLTYADEKELQELFTKEEAWESFIGGAVLGGGSSAINAIKSNKQGVDSVTGFNEVEQTVVDKVYKDRVAELEKDGKVSEKQKRKVYDETISDMDNGYISIDTIEEVLGGETYSNYKKLLDAEAKMQSEYDELGKKEKYTLADDARYKELGERLKYVREKGAKNELKTRLDEQVSGMVKDSRLVESYNERSRRGQKFEADLTQYTDEKQRAIVQKAVESGILNNTRKTHDFVDWVSRVSAEKGRTFDFANNAKLKESGFVVEGRTVNGVKTQDGIIVNIQSAKALDTVVGHEITHVLEGTELYNELQTAAIEYAKTKGDYQGRYDALVKLYKTEDAAVINEELTADIVGEYLFTDSDFISNLSTNHRNVFQKIYDEVKYLLKVATAGSKEARELEKVKRAFEKAYREGAKNNTAEDGGVKRSISETTDGRIAAVVDNDILANIDTTSWDNAKKEAAKKAASEALKQFSDGIVVNGITRKVNRISRNEYTRSEYAEKLFRNKPNVFADKMRAADVADDIVVAATNWTRDGGLKHPRTDNFVDFDHGTTLIVSGDAKYTAEVVVGITANGDAVFYDVVDLEPTTFDTKKAESPTTATTQNAIGDTHEDSAGGTVSQNDADVKYSINEVTEDGLTMTYVRVPNQNTPNFGSTYGQNIEPAGEYMSMDTMQGKNKIDGYEYGTIQFKKPLVLEHINTGETGWKKTVSDMYGGLTGKKLSAALIKDGYDAIVTYDEYGYSEIVNLNGKKLDNPQEGAKFSLSAEADTDYLAAVERGDTETAQMMVDEAAKAAGYDVSGYHGTDSFGFTVVDGSLWLARDRNVAKTYGPYFGVRNWDSRSPYDADGVYSFRYNLGKNLFIDAGGSDWGALPVSAEEYPGVYVDEETGDITTNAMAEWATGNGYDSITFANVDDGGLTTVDVVFDPQSHAKSAAPVTYDDDGNVIPLSQRFNPQNPDIRNSLSPEGAKPAADGNHGRYHVYGKDIALEEAIAPVRQDIAPATVSKTETVQDAATYEEPLDEESPYAELDRLTEQAEELERQMYEAMDAGDNEKAMEINADLVDAAVRITELEQQLDADAQERLASMEDADAPVMGEAPYSESTDTMTLPKKMVQDITRDARKALGFSAKQVPAMRTLVEKFSQGEIDSEQLHDEIARRFGTITEKGRLEDVAEVRNWLRTTRLNVSDEIKSDFPEYGKNVVRANRGRILFAKDGLEVDMYYAELADKFPGFFPADIINPADQLQRIIEVANEDINTESQTELDERFLDEVTDSIVMQVNEYRSEQRLKMSEQNAFESFNSLMRDADRYAPALEDDIAPVRADVAQAAPAEPVQESAPAADQPLKNVKERLTAKLHNLQTELQRNQQLREESNAEYEQQIAQLQTDYYERRNKNTKAANDILRRMERMRRLQGNEDARYAKRINDLSKQVAKVSEEARKGESPTEQAAMRQELHARKIEEMRFVYAERGYDFDDVLKNAKDLSTFATVDNTPQRVMEKALGYKEGQILADLTVNQVAANETKGIQWLNSYTDRKSGLLAQISKQYNIKPGSKESAAAQMYAEGFYVADNDDIIEYGDRELAQDFPDAKVQANIKGLARDPRIRQIYDATLAMINESRARNAYPEIQKLDNYFLHFRAMDDTFSRLGIPFNPNDIKAKDLPTDLNGVTADLKPGQPYFASAMHRKGKRTSFDLLGGLERYLTSAKGQIYHIDDIQTLRALRNHIADSFGQAKGLEGLDAMTEEEAQEHIKEVYDGHLSTFAKFLNEEANVIAGKTALIDRGLEGIIGRRGMTFFDTLNRQVGANMVGFNVSSSLTNLIAPVQAFAKTNKAAFVKGFAQTVAGRVGAIVGKTDGFIENNPTMIRRQGADRFYRTPWQKVSDLGYALMGGIDSFSTEIIVRSKYNELVSKGMSAEQAVIEADKWASRLMGDRSLGQQPQIFNSKMLGIVTKFQLEVRNQLDSQFYDTIQEAKVSAEDIQNKQARNAKVAAQVASTFVQLAVVQHLFGKAFEAVAGYNPAFDIIEAIVKAFGWDDEEESEDTVLDNLGQGLASIAEDMPYYSVIKDSGRIPISSALPIGQLIKGEDKYGNEKSRLETVAEAAPYWLLPGGYGQIKKTKQGLGMFDEDLPIAGSYTDSGNLRFTVEDTLANRVQAAVFGQYASSNARDYFDNERQSLKKNQIQELVDVDIPIREYWDYREGLNEQETLADKFDYIAGLNLPIDKKNILINNVVDRKEAVDLTDYDQYADYEEFDFAVKNPEKYDFLQSVGVSVGEYNSFDDDTKDAYNWAYQNPEKYTLSRAVSDDVAVYRQYTKALNNIAADKDADGKSISGSRKTKVINYLNNLDADYYAKLILFKMEYNADDTYNREIIEYLNGRNDISFEEEVTILRELGFTVDADGTVRW